MDSTPSIWFKIFWPAVPWGKIRRLKRLTSPSGDASLDDAADLGIREGVRIFLVFKFGGDDERLPGCEMVPFLRLLGVRFF
jgi:hypothetical protein